jgi:hypothetical protein
MIARAELRGRGTALALQRSVRCSAFARAEGAQRVGRVWRSDDSSGNA